MESKQSPTRFGVLGSSFRCPRPGFYITSLLEREDKASVPNNDLSCIQALQNVLP